MKRIFKYNISTTEYSTINLPKDAEILSVRAQYNHIKLWATIDTKASIETRKLRIFGTGDTVVDIAGFIYLDTVMLGEGKRVFHVFIEGTKEV